MSCEQKTALRNGMLVDIQWLYYKHGVNPVEGTYHIH